MTYEKYKSPYFGPVELGDENKYGWMEWQQMLGYLKPTGGGYSFTGGLLSHKVSCRY